MSAPSNLTQRVLTALVGVGFLMSAIVWGGEWGTRLFALVISLGMVWEFSTMAFNQADRRGKRACMMAAAFLGHLFCAWAYQQEFLVITSDLIGVFAVFLLLANAHASREDDLRRHMQETMAAGFGVLYAIALPIFLPLLYQLSPSWVYFFLFVVWAGDIGAYFVGKALGKSPLYKAISPKKTVEGAVGGILLSIPVGILLGSLFFGADGFGVSLLASILVYCASQIGDLCESLLKRGFGAKDSGWILPGHGGMMDRFDGVVFALPVMYTSVILFS